MKKFFIRFILLPNMRVGAAYLREKDADSTGLDDEAAEGIDYAVTRLENWLNSSEAS